MWIQKITANENSWPSSVSGRVNRKSMNAACHFLEEKHNERKNNNDEHYLN